MGGCHGKPVANGEVLMSGYLNQRKCNKGLSGSGWFTLFFELTSDGYLSYYWHEDKRGIEGLYILNDAAVAAFARVPSEEEADELQHASDACFFLCSSYKDMSPKGYHKDAVKRVVCLAPGVPGVSKAMSKSLTTQWLAALKQVVEVHEVPATHESWKTGSRILVDPAFRKNAYHIPVSFTWHGDEEELRRYLGFPVAKSPSDRLEFMLEYKRKSLIGESELPTWKALKGTHVTSKASGKAAVVANDVLRAGRGYQSRWKVRIPASERKHGRDPNCVVVKVIKATKLRDSKSVLPFKPSTEPDPQVTVSWMCYRESTNVINDTKDPVWNETFRFPLWTPPNISDHEREEMLEDKLNRDIEFLVEDWNRVHSTFLGHATCRLPTFTPVPDVVEDDTSSDLDQSQSSGHGVGAPATGMTRVAEVNLEMDHFDDATELELQPLCMNTDHTDDEEGPRGVLKVTVSLVYDDAMDTTWTTMLSPMQRAPNLVLRLRSSIPLLGMITDHLPYEMWEVKHLEVGDSKGKLALKDALVAIEEMLYFNCFDVRADIVKQPGHYEKSKRVVDAVEGGLLAAQEKTEDPLFQHKVRAAAMEAPAKAVMVALKKACGLNLAKIMPKPLSLFIPENHEPDLERLRVQGWRGWNHLDKLAEEKSNTQNPVAQGGIRLAMPTYEQVRDAVLSKRPEVLDDFTLPVAVEWVCKINEDLPKKVEFFYSPCVIREPVAESPALKAKSMAKKFKDKLPGPPSSSEDSSDVDDEAKASLYPEETTVCTVERVREICLRSRYVDDVYIHRTDEDMPCTVALVVPNTEAERTAEDSGVHFSLTDSITKTYAIRYTIWDDICNQITVEEKYPPPHSDFCAVEDFDFVRALALVATINDDMETVHTGLLDELVQECRTPLVTLEGRWKNVELTPPKISKAFSARVLLRDGAQAYKWRVDGKWFYDYGEEIEDQSDEYACSTFRTYASTPFGIGMDLGV